MINPETLAAQYKGKVEVEPVTEQDLYLPGANQKPSAIGQIPKGTPVPEGAFLQQVVGRGIAVVPHQEHQPNQPQMMVMPPRQSTRTTIGTIVEPSKTNPLSVPETPAQPQPITPKSERKLDIAGLILDHIVELGGPKSEDAQKFYDKSHDTLEKWMKVPAQIQLGALVKYLGKSPDIKADLLDQLEPHFSANGQEGSVTSLPNRTKVSVMICTAVLDRPTLPYTTALAYLTKKYELGFTFQADTMIARSRNMLAKRFLDSGCTWSLWIDSDMAPPIANPDWFRWITNSTSVPDEYSSYDVLERLLSSRKAIIGGVYASRKWQGALVIQPEIHPRSHQDKLISNDIRKGTARGLIEVNWVGFGCALIHREVFLEVQRTHPHLKPESEFAPWRFFHTESDEGEDEAFCRRVRICNIPIWLDTQLVCGHIGSQCFLPEHTAYQMAL